MTFKIECSKENAPKFIDWIKTRGGVAEWKSINLSNPAASWSTPARNPDGTPTQKPTWQAANEPAVIVTDPNEVGVYSEVLYKAIAVKLSQRGTALKLTDASQRKLDKVLAQCKEEHGDAHYTKGDLFDPTIAVFHSGSVVPLATLYPDGETHA